MSGLGERVEVYIRDLECVGTVTYGHLLRCLYEVKRHEKVQVQF